MNRSMVLEKVVSNYKNNYSQYSIGQLCSIYQRANNMVLKRAIVEMVSDYVLDELELIEVNSAFYMIDRMGLDQLWKFASNNKRSNHLLAQYAHIKIFEVLDTIEHEFADIQYESIKKKKRGS